MDSNYIITPNGSFISSDELYHWGIKGMKWGVRRYQNADGSLTSAGRKRYLNSDGTLNKAGRKKFGDSVNVEKLKRKKAEDMTDDELDRAIIRARKEDEYNRLRPEQVSDGKNASSRKLMSRLIDDVVVPAAINSGRTALQNALNKSAEKLLKEKPDPNSLEALRKVAEKLRLQKEINTLKNGKTDDDLSWDDRTKKYNLERQKKKDAEADAEKAAKVEAARLKEEAESRRRREQNRSTMNRASANRNKTPYDDFYRSNASRQREYDFGDGNDTTVEGSPRSSNKNTTSRTKSKPVVDADGFSYVYDEPVTSFTSSSNVSSGRSLVSSYGNTPIRSLPSPNISGYLPAPKDDDD